VCSSVRPQTLDFSAELPSTPTMSSPGADPSSAASASSAAAATAAAAAAAAVAGASAGSVFVKRAGDVDAVFAEVDIYAGDNVARLAERASAKFRWLVGADKIKLFLVPADSEDAVAAGVDGSEGLVLATRPLSSIKALSAVGISNRSCLLARLPDPPVAAAGECARAIRSLPSCLSSRGAGGARGTCERFRWGLCWALTPFPSTLPFHPSQAAAAAATRLLQRVVAAAVKPDRQNSAKSWADWS